MFVLVNSTCEKVTKKIIEIKGNWFKAQNNFQDLQMHSLVKRNKFLKLNLLNLNCFSEQKVLLLFKTKSCGVFIKTISFSQLSGNYSSLSTIFFITENFNLNFQTFSFLSMLIIYMTQLNNDEK